MSRKRAAIFLRQLENTVGTARNALEQTRLLRQLGYDVALVGERVNNDYAKWYGARTVRLWRWPLRGYKQRLFFDWRAKKFLAGEKFNLVIGHGDIRDQDILTMHNCVHLHAEWVEGQTLATSHEHGRFHEEILRGGDYRLLIANSQLMKKDFIQRFGIDAKKIEVCYPGFPREQFNMKDRSRLRGETRARLGVKDGETLVGTITPGDFKKRGLDYALQSFAKLQSSSSLKFLAVGQDTEIETYKRLAGELGVGERVIFLKPENKVEALYHALDIFMLPARLEEFGRTVIEAMACGLPVLVSNRAGAAEVLQSKQLIRAPQDIEGWTQGLTELIINRDWRQSIARQNAERALLLDEAQFAKRMMQILQDRGMLAAR